MVKILPATTVSSYLNRKGQELEPLIADRLLKLAALPT
jgi:hypothetical protein